MGAQEGAIKRIVTEYFELGERIMPVVVACKCGKKFAAPEHLGGRQLPCPDCGNALVISSTGPNASQGIVLFCECGRAFHADESQRGSTARCRGCGRVLQVPGPDPLGLGDTGLTPVQHAASSTELDGSDSEPEIPWPILKVIFAVGLTALVILIVFNTLLQIVRMFWP